MHCFSTFDFLAFRFDLAVVFVVAANAVRLARFLDAAVAVIVVAAFFEFRFRGAFVLLFSSIAGNRLLKLCTMELLLSMWPLPIDMAFESLILLAIISCSISPVSAAYGEFSASFSVRMYFMASRSVVILVSFSLFVEVGVPLAIAAGTQLRRFSKALFISRIRVRSRALAVFRRYLLSGAALGFFFSFGLRAEGVAAELEAAAVASTASAWSFARDEAVERR